MEDAVELQRERNGEKFGPCQFFMPGDYESLPLRGAQTSSKSGGISSFPDSKQYPDSVQKVEDGNDGILSFDEGRKGSKGAIW